MVASPWWVLMATEINLPYDVYENLILDASKLMAVSPTGDQLSLPLATKR
jgi:hypothetical protein